MNDLLPCPCCGGNARLTYEKQYKILIQDWHEVDESLYLPARITCDDCGLNIGVAGNKKECGGASGAQKYAKAEAKRRWNTRTPLKENHGQE